MRSWNSTSAAPGAGARSTPRPAPAVDEIGASDRHFGGGWHHALQTSPRPRKVHIMASSLIEPIARFGFAARGAVYIMVGVLAARAAAGRAAAPPTRSGAVRDDRTPRRERRAARRARPRPRRLRGVAFRAGGPRPRRQGQRRQGTGGARGFMRPAASSMPASPSPRAASGPGGLGLGARLGGATRSPSPGARGRSASAAPPSSAPALYQFYKAWAAKFEEHLRIGQMSAERAALGAAHRPLRPRRARRHVPDHRLVPRPRRAAT